MNSVLVPAHPEEALVTLLRGRTDGEEISKRIVPPQDADTVAYLTVRLHANGSLSVQGHIFDKRMALQLLDHARDVIGARQDLPATEAPLFVPSRDVEASPDDRVPLTAYGDLLPHERGDG